jgi:uncharacterized protein YjdB
VTIVPRIACLASITMTPASVTLILGDTAVAQTNIGASCVGIPSGGVSWTSADSTVLAVDPRDGDRAVLRAKKPGQVTVTARANRDPTISGSLAATVVSR